MASVAAPVAVRSKCDRDSSDPGGLNDAGPNAKTTYSSSAGVGAVRTVAYDTGALPGAVKPSASPCALVTPPPLRDARRSRRHCSKPFPARHVLLPCACSERALSALEARCPGGPDPPGGPMVRGRSYEAWPPFWLREVTRAHRAVRPDPGHRRVLAELVSPNQPVSRAVLEQARSSTWLKACAECAAGREPLSDVPL